MTNFAFVGNKYVDPRGLGALQSTQNYGLDVPTTGRDRTGQDGAGRGRTWQGPCSACRFLQVTFGPLRSLHRLALHFLVHSFFQTKQGSHDARFLAHHVCWVTWVSDNNIRSPFSPLSHVRNMYSVRTTWYGTRTPEYVHVGWAPLAPSRVPWRGKE